MERSAISVIWVVICVLVAAVGLEAAEQATPTMSLQRAASQGDLEQLNLHIARGTDLNAPDGSNVTALARATQAGRLEAVKLLVGAGADVNGASLFGPPLVIAVSRKQQDIMEYLVGAGADVNVKGRGGETALIAAAALGEQEYVEFLVGKGADVNAQDDRGQTALSAARRFPDIGAFLRAQGAQEPQLGYGDDPYGGRGMGRAGGASGGQGYRSMEREADVLADPNALRAKIAAVPGLVKDIAAVDANAVTEERGWASRRGDNRATLLRAVGRQFAGELTFLKGVAAAEKAEKTVAAIDELASKRKDREAVVAGELREARRLELEEARGVATRGRGRGATRASRGRGMSQEYGDPAGMGYGGAYGGMEPGQIGGRPRRAEDVEEPLDADTETQVSAWLGADPADKRTLLTAVHELDLFELEGVRLVAEEEEASKTVTAIEGVMLARQTRVERIQATMAEEDARLERLAERAGGVPGVTRSRRGRGGVQPAAPQGQTPTTARRRRRGR